MMRIVINDQKEVISYVLVGDVEGSIEFDGNIPDDFASNFKPELFRLQGNDIILNSDYSEPETPVRALSEQDAINAQLFKMNLDLKKQLQEMKVSG